MTFLGGKEVGGTTLFFLDLFGLTGLWAGQIRNYTKFVLGWSTTGAKHFKNQIYFCLKYNTDRKDNLKELSA